MGDRDDNASQFIYQDGRFLGRADKEELLGQRGVVFWLYGLSGCGKSTLAAAAERILHGERYYVVSLDGDNMRKGLNAGLGFSDEDRAENIRRLAEVARLLAANGAVVLVSAITPFRRLRAAARAVVGADFREVYVSASYETCSQRDPKGLYKHVRSGKVGRFTGRDSAFEPPDGEADVVLDTEAGGVEDCARQLADAVRAVARKPSH